MIPSACLQNRQPPQRSIRPGQQGSHPYRLSTRSQPPRQPAFLVDLGNDSSDESEPSCSEEIDAEVARRMQEEEDAALAAHRAAVEVARWVLQGHV